ncbi:S24 family peptidase [Alcaligenes aquatilis]|uniref:S24 family peptidase n=1 Tax=Alcaligenes aquatilis TaxID=323284 RepID=UPI00361F8A4B
MNNKKAVVTEEHLEEARSLKAIWDEVRPCTQAEFGDAYDIGSQSAVGNFLSGRSALSMKAAVGFSRGLGVPISRFSPRLAKEASAVAGLVDEAPVLEKRFHQKQRPGIAQIPVLEVTPSAGPGADPADITVVQDYLEVTAEWARAHLGPDLKRFRVLPIHGDSMSPTINDGDLVFVDTGITEFRTEGIYVIIWNERLLIKRLCVDFSSQKIEIKSDNRELYGSQYVSADEVSRLHICGLVRQWWSMKRA